MDNQRYKRDLGERLLRFSVRIIALASELPKSPAGYALANQIIRSACSVGANFSEAQDAISSKEFLHSLNISLKEARETLYWLNVIKMSRLIQSNTVNHEIEECGQIVAILVSTVKSLKRKAQK